MTAASAFAAAAVDDDEGLGRQRHLGEDTFGDSVVGAAAAVVVDGRIVAVGGGGYRNVVVETLVKGLLLPASV